ncbi:hypothetical protein CCUS01_03595, partial [Colletotrichum cuscutae]
RSFILIKLEKKPLYKLKLLNTIRYYPVFYILLLKLILRASYIEDYITIKLN